MINQLEAELALNALPVGAHLAAAYVDENDGTATTILFERRLTMDDPAHPDRAKWWDLTRRQVWWSSLDIARAFDDMVITANPDLEPLPALLQLSKWIDAGNAHRDPEAISWGRLAKISEEHGEAIAAYIGATGQNPRKGHTHTIRDVLEELLDVAITALGAYEHLDSHNGRSLDALNEKILRVARRRLSQQTLFEGVF